MRTETKYFFDSFSIIHNKVMSFSNERNVTEHDYKVYRDVFALDEKMYYDFQNLLEILSRLLFVAKKTDMIDTLRA